MLKLKDGVNIVGLQASMYFAACCATLAFDSVGQDCELTAAVDGDHNSGSLHSKGLAIDVHNLELNLEEHANVYALLRFLERYGFDVVDEHANQTGKTTAPHFHIEYQPKYGERQSIFL